MSDSIRVRNAILGPGPVRNLSKSFFCDKKFPHSAAQHHTTQILLDTQPFLTLLARLCEGLPQPGHYIFQTLGWFLWRLFVRLPFTHPSVDGFARNITRR